MTSYNKQWIDFKDGVNNLDLLFLHPYLTVILGFINAFCYENGIKFRVTSLIRSEEENKRIGSKSKTHVQGRAMDISIRPELGWTYEKIQLLVDQVNDRFSGIGAISYSDGLSRPIVVHNVGHGAHIHVQVRGGYKSAIEEGKI